MKDILLNWFTGLNSWLIHISSGKIGTKLGSQSILILNSVGRKSGKVRVTPIAYFNHEGKFLVVASNWGRAHQADWFLNLMKEPRATIEVEGKTIPVETRRARGEEYSRLWKFATERHPPYLNYQKMTARPIPIVVLDPILEK
jgi:deazaflavin-dependent oxidoreductase (nitroreductase family)